MVRTFLGTLKNMPLMPFKKSGPVPPDQAPCLIYSAERLGQITQAGYRGPVGYLLPDGTKTWVGAFDHTHKKGDTLGAFFEMNERFHASIADIRKLSGFENIIADINRFDPKYNKPGATREKMTRAGLKLGGELKPREAMAASTQLRTAPASRGNYGANAAPE
jgi:hypothetical protein